MRNTIRIKRDEILFYGAWILFLCSLLLEQTAWHAQGASAVLVTAIKAIRYIAYGGCCLKIIGGVYRRGTLFGCFVILVIFLLSGAKSVNKTMVLYLLILLAAIDVDGRNSIKIACIVQGIFLCAVVALAVFGVLTDFIFDPEGRMRHGLGFSWTTTAPILYFYAMLSYVYLRREKFSLKDFLILEGVNIWLYKMTDARLTFILSSCYLLFFAIEAFQKQKWKFWKHFESLYYLVPAMIGILSVVLYWQYDSGNYIWEQLNDLLSNRLYLGKNAFLTYGVSLFGQKIEWIGFSLKRPTVYEAVGYNYVDCSYVQLLLEYGIFFLITVIGIYTVAMYRAVKSQDYYLIWILIVVLMFGITEPRLMNFAFNPFPLLAFCDLKGEGVQG